jgi:uncharacterized protein YoxC
MRKGNIPCVVFILHSKKKRKAGASSLLCVGRRMARKRAAAAASAGKIATGVGVNGHSSGIRCQEDDDNSVDEVDVRDDKSESSNESESEEEEDDVDEKLGRKELLLECKARRKKLKKVEDDLKNKTSIVNKLVSELEDTKREILEMKERTRDEGSSTGTSTVSQMSSTSSVLVLAKDYSSSIRTYLGKFIRTELFKKHKVTNKQSFDDGEIQRLCHRQLGREYKSEEMLRAYKESLVKLVNYELGQRRSSVNAGLVKAWKGKWFSLVILSPCLWKEMFVLLTGILF